MAIRETLELDLSQALSQLDDLERELDALLQPIVIPVEVETDQALDQLRRDIRAADADDIDIDVDVEGVARAEGEFEDLRQEVDRTDDGLEKVERQAKRTGDDLARAGKKGRTAFSGLTKGILAFGAALGGIAALRGLARFFGESIDAASDLEESTSKAQVVFGEFFDDIQRFSTTAPQALGLANAAALEFTGTFGNLFVALGLSQEAAADLAPEIVQLGADLASFNNIEVTDALDKLRAGLVGEAEPLRALGVNLTAATTAAKAMELGLVGVDGAITEAAKVQARYALILEQTATAQGDFARTSEGLANRQRTLAAEFENFRAAVGEALIPAFEAVLDLAPALIEAIETGLVPAIESFAAAVASVDTAALATDLAQLPSAIDATLGGISSATQGLANVGQALAALALIDPREFFRNLGEGVEDFNNIFAQQTARQAIQNLIVTLGAGVAPGDAFESTLVELGKSVDNLNLEQFEGLVDQLVAIADLSDVEIAEQIRLIRDLGTAAGFSEAGIDILVQALLEARSAAGALPPPLDEVARGIAGAGEAAREGGPPLKLFADELEVIADTLRRGQVNAAIAELEAQFETLPGVIGAAADAIETEGDDVIKSLTGFITDFRDALEALETFEANLAILRALGLDQVADIFADLGPENAAQAAADAVLNPSEAQELADLLAGRVSTVGPAITGAIAESIAGEPITDALVDEIIAAAEDADSPAVRQALLDLANALTLTIPVAFGDLPDLTVGQAVAAGAGFPIGANVGAGAPGVTVVQNFDNTPSPTTETTRAAQEISSLIG